LHRADVEDASYVSLVYSASIFRVEMCRLALANKEIKQSLGEDLAKKYREYKLKIPHSGEKSLDSRMSGSYSVRLFISFVNSR
jgi:hypothetical protein